MPVEADAVDSSIAPVHSFLAPGANVVAQALLADSTIRALSAVDLARTLHTQVQDARDAIASIVGMIGRSAGGDQALRQEASLSQAVGPFMSLDQAMSRYGSRMGPIVRGPEPSPLWHPDVGPDRQYGAGRLSEAGASGGRSSRGRGHSGPRDYGEAGDVPADLESAASMMITYLTTQGCGPDASIGDFQTAFNAAGYTPALTVDNKYGALTRASLVQVLSDSQQVTGAATLPNTLTNAAAPPACAYAPAPVAPRPATVIPAPGAPVLQASLASNPWVWGVAALVAGGMLLSRSKHPPRWARKIGLHR